MKTDKSFKLNSQAKRMLATIYDKKEYSFYKGIAIENQLAIERAEKRAFKVKGKETGTN